MEEFLRWRTGGPRRRTFWLGKAQLGILSCLLCTWTGQKWSSEQKENEWYMQSRDNNNEYDIWSDQVMHMYTFNTKPINPTALLPAHIRSYSSSEYAATGQDCECNTRHGGWEKHARVSTSGTSVRYLHTRADVIGVHRINERIRTYCSFDVHHFVLSKTGNVHFGSRWERVLRWCQRIQVLCFHIFRPGKRHNLVWVLYRYKRNLRKYPR